MAKVGIFFGTDTGKTRKIAKMIHKAFGSDDVEKPLNINRASVDDLLAYDFLILGTPTLGEGQLPGLSCGCEAESWEEFAPELEGADLSGKTIALFGLGDQAGYPDEFVDAMGELYDIVSEAGAKVVGFTSTAGYDYNQSNAAEEDKFVGLVIDQDNQADQTDARVAAWVESLKAEFAL